MPNNQNNAACELQTTPATVKLKGSRRVQRRIWIEKVPVAVEDTETRMQKTARQQQLQKFTSK